jgi:hypothetical protein
MDLDLSGFAPPTPIITCTIEGILEPEDLAALAAGGADVAIASAKVDDPTDLKKIRERHHAVARLMANGMKPGLVAALTGYTGSYISVLMNNPAMQELVELYRIKNGSAMQVITENLRTVGSKATEKLNEKLDADEINDVHELVAIAKLGHDRSGHGPSSTTNSISETHVIDHAKLAELNRQAREGSSGQIRSISERRGAVIEHKAEPHEDA